jgi:hypothetical protein
MGELTDKSQKQIRQYIRQSNNIISKEDKFKYININPTTPNIYGLIKIHKHNMPIRSTVNWQNVPAYKTAKFLTWQLKQLSP